MAVSWGAHESLVLPACAFNSADHKSKRLYPGNLVRLYVGLEDADSLIADLKHAPLHCV